jgi:hypothetical protein
MNDTPRILEGVDNSTLDAALVLAALILVGAGMGVLAFVPVPDRNLPVFTAGFTAIIGILTTYAGFRWGSSVTAKRLAGQQE